MKLKSLLRLVAVSILVAATLLEVLPALTSGRLTGAVYGRETAVASGTQVAEHSAGALRREPLERQTEADVRVLIERTEENLLPAGSFGFN